MSKPASSESIGAIFPTAFAHFVSLCHILVILAVFQIFHYYYICYGDLWSVTLDVAVQKDYDSLKAQMMVSIF